MKKSKIATALRQKRTAGMTIPKNTNNEDLLRWWKAFIDGDSAVFIAEKEGRALAVIEKGIAYTAAKLGAPSAYVEKCRLIESYHRTMVDLNFQLELRDKAISEIESAMGLVKATPFFAEGDIDTIKLWQSLAAQRNSEANLRVKIQQELRAVSIALENIFGLKHLAVPDNTEEEEVMLSELEKMPIEKINRLLEAADEKDIQDAIEIKQENERNYVEPPRSL